MSSTDDRIVKMEFDNAQFKKGAAETQKSLADLNKSVDAAGNSKGLLTLDSNMQRVGVTASKMAIITTTALATITNKVVNAGLSIAKSLTFDPLKQGFNEYQALLTKQNTIQNATGKSAVVVKKTLKELNNYSDKTIYSFGNMTDAITKFVNAGVPLKQSVISIKGIANAAAYAGASSEEANRAMYAFSQSMSLGFVQLQDWNQIENANLGTVQFKQTLIDAAVATGELTKQGKEYVTKAGTVISATKGWRDGLKDQWATTEVLNKALGKYADTTTKLGKKAFESATEVRTFSAFMDTLKESIGSGWAGLFGILIGGLNNSTKLWTGLSNSIGGAVKSMFHWVATTLLTWRKMGGFQKTMEGFKNLLAPIGALFSTVGKAFRSAFPDSGKGSGKILYGMSAAFAAITSPLKLLAKIIEGSIGPLTIFFQLFHIGITIVKEITGYISDFVKNALGLVDLKAPSSGGMLQWIKDLGSAISDTLGQITHLLDKGASIKDAFGSIGMPDLPSLPHLPSLGNLLGGGGDVASGGTAAISKMSGPLAGMSGVLSKVTGGFSDLAKEAKDAGSDVKAAGGTMGDVFMAVWKVLSKFFAGFNFDDLVASFNLAVLSTFMLSVARFFNTMSKSFEGFAGIGGGVKGVLDKTGDALKSFQTAARAKLILNIAIAIGILAASLWVLSKIPMKDLAGRLVIMGGVFYLLNASMKRLTGVIEAMSGANMAGKLIAFSVAIVAMATAMLLLATAMLIFNKVKVESVAKGLITMAVAMKLIESLGDLSKGAAGKMLAGAAAIAIVSGSMLLLATALLAFKLVDWGSMGKAGAALAGVALAVGLLALIPYQGIAKVGLALLTASVGMNAIAVALLLFSMVKWSAIGKAAVVLGLLTISLAILMAVGGPVAAGAMVGLAAAMVGLALACLMLNKVDWSSIAKLTAVLVVLLAAIALGATILAVFLYVIAPVTPVLMALAGAFALLGLGLLAFSAAMALAITLGAAGVAAFAALATGAAVAVAVFMQTLAAEAPILKKAFLDILQSLIDTIVEAVPMIIDGIKRLFVAVIAEFKGDDKKKGMGDSGKSWMQNLWEGIKAKMPMIVEKAKELAISFIKMLASKADDIALVGVSFLVALLRGIAKKVPDIVDAAVEVIKQFIKGIANGAVDLINAGIDAIATFLHGLASAIRNGSAAIGAGLTDVFDAMKDVGVNMVKGMISGVTSMVGDAVGAVKDLGGSMISGAKNVLKIFSPSRVFMVIGKFVVMGMTKGIQDHAASAITATASMVSGQIAVANEYINGFIQKLDQSAIAARAKADGLAAAAQRAAQLANKTKTKTDDKAANKLGNQANQADKAATEAEKKAEQAKNAQDRKEQFKNADLLEKAQMRSEDAQRELDSAKAHEAKAAKALAEADALDKQAKAEGVTPEQRKKLQKEADALRAQAAKDAQAANKDLNDAKKAASDALAYQKKAGAEAAAAFQDAFNADAKKAADDAAFEKLSDEEKAILRRKQADELQKKAEADLLKAKRLAYTDIEAANALAQQAMSEADQARQYLNDAQRIQDSLNVNGVGTSGTAVNLDLTDAASLAMSEYSDRYSAAVAAAAGDKTVQFNQYNTSPEALSPSELYRQSNNLFTYAVKQLEEAAA